MGRGKGARKTATRSETVSVRLDPRLRYLADLAARSQRRTLSSYVECAVAESLSRTLIAPRFGSITRYAEFLWHVDPIERFLKLAFLFEDLLNHDEELVWNVIRENRYFWKAEQGWYPVFLDRPLDDKGRIPDDSIREEIEPGVAYPKEHMEAIYRRDTARSPSPDIDKIKKHWQQIRAVATGEASPDTLPAAESAAGQPKPAPRKPRKEG